MKNNFFIFGEQHFNQKSKQYIHHSITQIKPHIIAHELLYEDICMTKQDIINRLSQSDINKTCDPRLNLDVYQLGLQIDAKLIGIDLDKDFTHLSLEEAFLIREQHMLKKIKEIDSFQENKKIVVVIGEDHLRKNSFFSSILMDYFIGQKNFRILT